MNGIVLFSLAVLLLFIALAVGVFSLARNRILRYHRVDPHRPTTAPLLWSVDPRAPARLHRRLTRVGTATSRIATPPRHRRRMLRRAPEPTSLQNAAAELREQAVSLDRQLAGLAALDPSTRRIPLLELTRSIERLETATTRLIDLERRTGAPDELADAPDPLDRAAERVDFLALAHEELLQVDDRSGLRGGNAATSPPVDPESTRRDGETPGRDRR